MRLLATAFLTILLSNLTAQTRISGIDTGGANEASYVKHYNGTNYLIQRTNHDSLKVYEVLSTTEKLLLHSRAYSGLGQFYDVSIVEDKVLLSDGGVPVVYNYVQDEERRYELPDDWLLSYWTDEDTEQALLSTTNPTNTDFNMFVIHYEDGVFELDSTVWTRQLCGDYIFGAIADGAFGESSYVVYDYRTGVRDTIARFGDNSARPHYDGRYIYYFERKKLERYDTSTGIIEDLHFVQGVEDRSDPTLYSVGDELFIQANRNGGYVLEHYDIVTETKIADVELPTSGLLYRFKTYGRVLAAVGSSTFVLYDMDNHRHGGGEISAPYLPDFLIDDHLWISNYGSEITVVNTTTMTSSTSVQSDISLIRTYLNYIKVGDKHLMSVGDYDVNQKSLFEIGLAFGVSIQTSPLVKSTAGLDDFETALLSLKSGIGVGSSVMVGIDENDNAIQLNDFAVRKVDARLFSYHNNKLHYITSQGNLSRFDIWSYDGDEHVLETSLVPSSSIGTPVIASYIVTDDHVLYVKNAFTQSTLEIKDLSSDVIEVLISDVSPGFGNRSKLYMTKDDVYFSGQALQHISQTGTVTDMDVVLPSFSIVEEGLYELGDRVLFVTDARVYELDGANAVQIYEGTERIEHYNSDSDEGVLHLIAEDILLVYTETDDFEVVVEGDIQSKYYVDGDIIAQVRPVSGETKIYRIDIDSGESTELPELRERERLHGWHQFAGAEYVIASRGSFETLELNIYKYDEVNSEYVSCFKSIGQGQSSSAALLAVSDTSALVYAGGVVGELSSVGTFHQFEGVKGEFRQEHLVRQGDEVFFIANDPTFGLQLYKYSAQSGGVSVVDQAVPTTQIEIVPNPVSDVLSVITGVEEFISADIYNTAGELVLESVSISSVDVSHLVPGVYVLAATRQDGSVRSATFVKQ